MESVENDKAVSHPSHRPWKSINPISTFPPSRRLLRDELISKTNRPKGSYERGCQEKNSPLLPCEGKLFALHPARCCGLAAYFLSVTQPVASFGSSVSLSRRWFGALG